MRRKLAWLVLFTFMFSIFPVGPAQAAGPAISEISPGIMPPGGGQLLISGSGLGAEGTKVILQIGTKVIVLEGADIVSSGPGFVIATVPSQDSSEFDATGIIQVDSLILTNNEGSSTKANPFKYMQNPGISHSYPFTIIDKYEDNGNPSNDDADKKTFLKIEGGFFDWVDKVYLRDKDVPDSSVKFGNFENPAGELFKDESDGGIYIEVSNILRGKDVEVKVENVGGYSSPWTEVPYYNEPGPYVASFDPRPDPIFVGSRLELTGANFFNGPDNTRVYIGGVRAEINSLSSGSIQVTVPNPQPGNRDIQIEVWNDGKRRGVSTYKDAAIIKLVPSGIKLEQILPNHGPVEGGNKIIIVGEKFDQTMTVFFEIDGQSLPALDCKTIEPPSYVGEGKTAFEVTVPPSPNKIQGPAKVMVVDRTQTSHVFAQRENLYFFSTAAQYLNLQSVTPNRIPFDQPTGLVLEGQYFSYFRQTDSSTSKSANGQDIEDINSINVGDTGVSQLILIEDIPGHYEGKNFRIERTILVTTGGVMAGIKSLNTVGNVQYLNIVSPVYPLGNKLEEQVDVQVSISEKTFYFDEDQWIECIDPSYYPLVEIGTLSGGLTITRTYPNPDIQSITPTYGPNLREQKVVIEGYNFFEGVTVTFAGVPAIINSMKQGAFDSERGFQISLEVTVPTTTVRGQVEVVVANTDGKNDSTEYTYVSSPAITSISPDIAPVTGGNHATLSGSRFMANSAVLIGDKLVCANDYTKTIMTNLLADGFFEQFGILAPVMVIDPDYRVIGADGSEIQSNNEHPDGTKIFVQVPAGTQGNRDVYVINTDKGWDKLAQGLEYKVYNGSNPITVTPNEGTVEGGQEISIQGSGFLPNPYNPVTGFGVIVTIDGAVATIKQVSNANQTLTVITPPGSRVGVWTPVEVMNVSPEGIRLDVKEEGFRYHRVLTLPEIHDFFPKHGEKGMLVTVFGQNFATDPGAQIIFGSETLGAGEGVRVVNDGTIVFPVPDFLPGRYEITVKNPDTGMATAKDLFELQIPGSKPEIVEIQPAIGTVDGGTDVIVEGSDFHTGAELFLGGLPATNIQVELLEFDENLGLWSRCVIRAKTPARPEAGIVDVLVVNPDGGSAQLENSFEYVRSSSKPKINSVQPNHGPASGGEEVIVSGEDFRVARNADNEIVAWPQVTFGGHVAVVVMDDTITRTQGKQIKVITPVYAGGGRVDVTISNPDTGTFTLAGAYTFEVSKPVITGVMPSKFSRHQDSPGLIKGSGFMMPATVSDPNDPTQYILLPGADVLLGDASGQGFKSLDDYEGVTPRITMLNDKEIRVVLPSADRVGARILRVMNPDGGYADYQIKYVSPVNQPTITEIIPSQGSLNGGTNVAITGTHFADRLEVYFGDQLATVIQQSAENIVVRTPAISLPEGIFEKMVDVILINLTDYGTAYMSDGYKYVQVESEIAINQISPSQGPIQGGTTVAITGEGFRNGCQVIFGTVEAESVVYVSSSQLQVITPSHPKGTVDVTVRNPGPDYAEAHVEGGFTYEASMPSDFSAELWNQRAIKLSWTPSEFSSTYEIYANNSNDRDTSEFLISTNDTSYIFEKIESGRRYYFWLRTVNQQGASPLIACEDNPVYVTSSDVANRPPTAKIDDINTTIESDQNDLKIVVGNDIGFWHYSYYDIQLDGKQRSRNQVEILIPSTGINKNSTTTIRVNGNNYKLEIPLQALKTFEYQEFSRINPDFNVSVCLLPTSPGYLESLKVNRPGFRPVSGFDVLVTMKSNRQEKNMNLLAGDMYVSWSPGGTLQGMERTYGYDSFSRKWLDYTSFANTSTGMVRARVGGPNTFIIGR